MDFCFPNELPATQAYMYVFAVPDHARAHTNLAFFTLAVPSSWRPMRPGQVSLLGNLPPRARQPRLHLHMQRGLRRGWLHLLPVTLWVPIENAHHLTYLCIG